MNGKISELPSNHTYDPSRNIQQQRRYSTLRKVKLNPSFVSGKLELIELKSRMNYKRLD